MTPIKKIAAVALTSLTLAASFSPAAEARNGRNAAIALGVLGGLAAGAIIASQPRPAYAAPVYAAEPECFRRHVGYNDWGRPVFRTVCY
jgi:hypothetical protein